MATVERRGGAGLDFTKGDFFILNNHRMVPVPAFCHRQGYFPPELVAQSPIQPGLEHVQGWGIHNLSKQPVPVPHH